MKRFLLTLMFVVVVLLTHGQGLFLSDYRAPGKPLLLNDDGNVTGSPYLANDWGRGIVYINDKVKSDEVFIRFDVLNQMAEMKDASGHIFALDAKKIRGFKFTAQLNDAIQSFHFENQFAAIQDFPSTEYFEIVHSGKNKFLRHYAKKLVADPAAYGATKSKSVVDDVTYYVITMCGDVISFGENRKALLKAFPAIEDEINLILKRNQIRITDRNIIASLFQELDEMIN